MTLLEARDNIGKAVWYMPRAGDFERGVIVAVNTAYVFVRYGKDACSKATLPEDLELVCPAVAHWDP